MSDPSADLIYEVFSGEVYLMACEAGVRVLPKAKLRNIFKQLKPSGGVMIPSVDRDPPEKLARFLLRRREESTNIIGMLGFLDLIRAGPWQETRRRLLPNLLVENLPDPAEFLSIHETWEQELPPGKSDAVLADLANIQPGELDTEARHVLRTLQFFFNDLSDTIQDLLFPPVADAESTDPSEDEPEAGDLPWADLQVSAEHQTSTLPSDDFTVLDRWLLRSAVDSAGGIEGALPVEEFQGMVEELIHLNNTRTKSYFHRGFFEALTGTAPAIGRQEQNEERRAWEWSGRILGHARFERWELILQEYDQHRTLAKHIASGKFPGAAQGAVPSLLAALFDAGRLQEGCGLLTPVVVFMNPGRYIPDLVERSRDFIRAKRTVEAKLLLGKARELLLAPGIGEGCPPELRLECERRWGQVLRAESGYKEARSLFEGLLDGATPEREAELRTDMALCAARARWLDDVRLPCRNVQNGPILEQLAPARRDAEAALATLAPAPGAAYLLGVIGLLSKGKENNALHHLEQAYEMALAREEVYENSTFLNRVCLALALAILLRFDEAQFERAHDLLHRALDDGRLTDLPLDLIKRALEVLKMGAHPACLAILEDIQERCEDVLEEHLRLPELLDVSPAIKDLLAKRSVRKDRTFISRWNDLEALLKATVRSGDLPRADACLGLMEELALESDRLSSKYLSILRSDDLAGACLTDEERLDAEATLHRARGRRLEEGEAVLGLARLALGKNDPALGNEYLEVACALGIPEETLDPIKRWTDQLLSEQPPVLASSLSRQVSILFVGGNEVQARYDAQILDIFRRNDQRVRIEFIHPAWSSNWGPQVDEVRRKITEHQALVVMRFNRTMFGRHIRRIAGDNGKPWLPCTGHGRDSMVRAIERAAAFVRVRMR